MQDDIPPRATTQELAREWRREGRDSEAIELVNLLRRAEESITAEPDDVLARSGLSRGQFDVLTALHRSQPASPTQTELADRMMVTPAGMKKRLDSLYDRGIIARTPDATDARRLRIHLTSRGRELLADVLDAFFAAEARALATLSHDERGQMIVLLRRLVGETAE